MYVLGVAMAALIGISLGLLGGGGSILTVPILLYVFKLPTREAIATSLLVVAATSAAALIPHARAGRVQWRTGALFGLTSMVGAYGAGRVASHIPPTALLLAFGAMMLVTAGAMMRGRKAPADAPEQSAGPAPLPVMKIVLEGLVVGAVTGLVGAGGGFLVVPALVLLGRLPMGVAVGTSLLVIAMKSTAGFAGYLASTPIQWPLALTVAAVAVLGSVGGARLAGVIPGDALRRGFGWFVVVMAVFILGQEVPKAMGIPVTVGTHWPYLLTAMAIPPAAAALVAWIRRHRPTATA